MEQGLLRDAGDDLALAVIWIDILPQDDSSAARRARALLEDPRVTHFHDPTQQAGRAWERVLGLGDVAWDVYMLFEAGARWDRAVPTPSTWFHQLGDERADPERLRTGVRLAQALHAAGDQLGWPLSSSSPDAACWEAAQEAALSRLAMIDVDADGDGRCTGCLDAGRLSSCSLGGWRRLLLRTESGGGLMVSGSEPAAAAGDRREVLVSVTGLECAECLLHAGAGLAAVEGVVEIEVRLDDGRVRILLAPGAAVDDVELLAALRGQGFAAELLVDP